MSLKNYKRTFYSNSYYITVTNRLFFTGTERHLMRGYFLDDPDIDYSVGPHGDIWGSGDKIIKRVTPENDPEYFI